MKKIVLATVLTIAAMLVLIALALPFWFGLETEKTYRCWSTANPGTCRPVRP